MPVHPNLVAFPTHHVTLLLLQLELDSEVKVWCEQQAHIVQYHQIQKGGDVLKENAMLILARLQRAQLAHEFDLIDFKN